MKNSIKQFLGLFLISLATHAQVDIVKSGSYTVTATETLTASNSIRLLPNTWIKAGSTFVAKIDPNLTPIQPQTPYTPPSTSNENYILTRLFKTEMQDENGITDTKDVAENITYFDGLGRPMQQNAIRSSNTGKDIITNIVYDNFGRQDQDYLPYPSGQDNGSYIDETTALTGVANHYNVTKYDNTLNPFSQKKLEDSPLNRVMKQAAPGESWKMDGGHEVKFDYQTNTTADAVKLFSVTANWDLAKGLYDIPTDLTPADYAEFQLYKTITYDENTAATPTESNGSTVEFKDKEGKVVLKRTYESGIKHDTYYIYDQFGNLTFVIPPLVNATTTISNTILNDLGYQYKYDYRNRLVEKKLPSKQWEFIVYDKLDRVVATGPAFSPFSDSAVGAVGWMITKYDVFNRSVYTGWEASTTVTSAGRFSKQNDMNALTTISESKTTTTTTIDALTGIAYYTNDVEPKIFKLLTVNYYDDYTFQSFTPAIDYTAPVAYNNTTLKPKGLPTGSWVRVLTTLAATEGESSYILYDAKARPIKTFSANYLGGYTQTDSNLDTFSGRLNFTETRHKRSNTDTEILVKEVFTYTNQDRLLTHTHQINGGTPQLLAYNTYDELGQLIGKSIGNTLNTPLQKVDYSYNIRGWLTGINNDPTNNLVLNTNEKDLFAFKINYNTVENCTNYTGTALYNGNISETYWRNASDNTQRKYGYKYDNLNRLRESIYQKPGLTTAQTLVSNAYDENITYDKNGNIKSLNRKGNGDQQIGAMQIDDLTYVYMSDNSNQLLKVTDGPSGNDAEGFIDANKTDDYSYDTNGNMTVDNNKGITTINYNHLNLPTKITFATTGNITYIYNAAGQKLAKVVNSLLPTAIVTTTDYLGGFQYQKVNTAAVSLQFFPTAEGYVKNTAGVLSYVFNYTDHLGNVRVSYEKDAATGSLKIIDENNYYPFGLKHSGYNSITPTPNYKYKYNGKELQDELSLSLYDYGARNYDPAIGRWMNVDPLAEMSKRFTPYTYAVNNPVYFIDPDGMMQAPNGMPQGSKFDPPPMEDFSFLDMHYIGREADNGPGDPPAPGTGTSTGNMQGVIPAGQPNAGAPNGVDLPATQLDEVVVKGYKAPSYLQGYFEGPASGEYGPSSMNPDATGFSANVHLNTGIIGELNLNGGFAFDRNNNFALFGGYGGNFGYTGKLGSPNFGGGINFDAHYNYGGVTNVLGGLDGRNKSFFAGYAGLSGSISQSAMMTPNGGYVIDSKGVRTISFGLGAGFSGGIGISKGGVWEPFK